MAKPVSSRGSDQFVVRFPDGLRDRIKSAADENGRSMNSEIIERLESSFRESDEIPPMTSQQLRSVIETIEELGKYVKGEKKAPRFAGGGEPEND